ncbi:Asp-tRNA(Asn)/Glu-tRNA(Gln) amidotransferase GatCAB subunit A [Streptomyces venezuelae]|uniref:Asp-tRNA(Asn)/Glu-tRNA(Gln) amidotransferase GatCAB subunit A n=1 Tax=Streptomyces venezuelae TaxID=54571 RepID=A0A5P2C896_STRVZ|nr:amidase [Streptomyces venezuelae]QES38470.1 Asp-tRNA(Asn)/Glu-tRNA(Gln) amidotransferase GatCAB subunit A [Streptomyces venezuelae]
MQPYELTLAAAAEEIRTRRLSPVELVDSVLDRIARTEPSLQAYVTVTAERARASARAAERATAPGAPAASSHGPLHGIPVALKDLIDVAGVATTASSRVRADHPVAAADSTVAARLAEAGTALVGKTHTHEFAYGLTTPQTGNAWDPDRVAGGSSGGSAVAVAAAAATFALGTDTGGSIRVPAALNGVVGLKPTYGLVPRHGVTSLSWSLDHVGPLTRTVEDAALVMSVLAGHDPRDPASLPTPPGVEYRPLPGADLTGVRVGVPRNYYFEHVDPEVEVAVRGAVKQLEALGATLVEVEIPMTRYVQATQWGLMVPEATAYHEQTLRSAPEQYGADIRVLLEAGALMSAGDYLRAQRARTLMRQAWLRMLDEVDVIAAPTVPLSAVRTGQEVVVWPDGTSESVSDAYVRLSAPADITGVPALSVPVGRDAAGMPIGMQLLGRPLAEAMVLRVGHAYEEAVPARGPAPVTVPAGGPGGAL